MKKGDKSLIINKLINFDFYKIRNNLVEIELIPNNFQCFIFIYYEIIYEINVNLISVSLNKTII